ncbi:hypothetical protein INR49_019999 [Caranx melampygus]|nr:hypothetical protein INR49_019999 [Caranx melampygus]
MWRGGVSLESPVQITAVSTSLLNMTNPPRSQPLLHEPLPLHPPASSTQKISTPTTVLITVLRPHRPFEVCGPFVVWKPNANGGRLYSNSPLKRWNPDVNGGVSGLLSKDGLRRYGVSSVLERLIMEAKRKVGCKNTKEKTAGSEYFHHLDSCIWQPDGLQLHPRAPVTFFLLCGALPSL